MFGRRPESDELDAALGSWKRPQKELSLVGLDSNAVLEQSFQSLIRSLVRLNEFVYVDYGPVAKILKGKSKS